MVSFGGISLAAASCLDIAAAIERMIRLQLRYRQATKLSSPLALRYVFERWSPNLASAMQYRSAHTRGVHSIKTSIHSVYASQAQVSSSHHAIAYHRICASLRFAGEFQDRDRRWRYELATISRRALSAVPSVPSMPSIPSVPLGPSAPSVPSAVAP